jgi:mRNA export factor
MMNPNNANKDFEVPGAPEDTVSSLVFAPKANYLASTSWDNSVRVWEVGKQQQSYTDFTLQAAPKLQQMAEGPVLSVCWSDVKTDDSGIFI